MASHSRHAARTQEWPALSAGRAPLPLRLAPAAERQVVRRHWPRITGAIFIAGLVCASSFAEEKSYICFDFQSPTQAVDQAIVVANLASVPVEIDPGVPGGVVLQRLNTSTTTWEDVDVWGCANAGAGTSHVLQPGESRTMRVHLNPEASAARLTVESGKKRPYAGVYRYRVRYSFLPWHVLIPPAFIMEQVSISVFVFGGA